LMQPIASTNHVLACNRILVSFPTGPQLT
jgi:hypothetical protein